MEEKNDKISYVQIACISALLGNAFFVGLGITGMFNLAKQDTWIATIIAGIIGLIPIGLLLFIINYKPDKTLFEKNKILFGNIIGNIVNIVIIIYVVFLFFIVITTTIGISNSMYLTKTPSIVIAALFILPAVYANIKGIETIGRTFQILLVMDFLAFTVISALLLTSSGAAAGGYDELRPVLINGIGPVIKYALAFLSYCITPLLILSVIPKNNVIDNKKYSKYLIIGFFISVFSMLMVFTTIPSVITIDLAEIYRFPAYYVQRRINIGGVITNVENFFSLHWFLNAFSMIAMSIYFISKYIKDLFKVKQKKNYNITIWIIGLIGVFFASYTTSTLIKSFDFIKYQFPVFVGGTFSVILLATCLTIFIKKRLEKKTT